MVSNTVLRGPVLLWAKTLCSEVLYSTVLQLLRSPSLVVLFWASILSRAALCAVVVLYTLLGSALLLLIPFTVQRSVVEAEYLQPCAVRLRDCCVP